MPDGDDIAKRQGFRSYAEMIAASYSLPRRKGDLMQSYVARHPNGHWLVWERAPQRAGDGATPPALRLEIPQS